MLSKSSEVLLIHSNQCATMTSLTIYPSARVFVYTGDGSDGDWGTLSDYLEVPAGGAVVRGRIVDIAGHKCVQYQWLYIDTESPGAGESEKRQPNAQRLDRPLPDTEDQGKEWWQ